MLACAFCGWFNGSCLLSSSVKLMSRLHWQWKLQPKRTTIVSNGNVVLQSLEKLCNKHTKHNNTMSLRLPRNPGATSPPPAINPQDPIPPCVSPKGQGPSQHPWRLQGSSVQAPRGPNHPNPTRSGAARSRKCYQRVLNSPLTVKTCALPGRKWLCGWHSSN